MKLIDVDSINPDTWRLDLAAVISQVMTIAGLSAANLESLQTDPEIRPHSQLFSC